MIFRRAWLSATVKSDFAKLLRVLRSVSVRDRGCNVHVRAHDIILKGCICGGVHMGVANRVVTHQTTTR